VLLALLLALAQFTQVDTGELRLRVVDAGGLPLQCSVELRSESAQFHAEYTTDAAGVLVARRLPFGSYRLTVTRDAFAPFSASVQIRSAQPVDLPVTLSVAAIQSQVTVRAGDTLIDTRQTASVQHLGTDIIRSQALALPGRSLPDLVDTQPGWLMEANGVLHPRGSEYQTQYVVDGLPLTDNRSPAFAPAIDAEAVQSMAIRTGGYPAEYGRKLGGIIEVVTAGEERTGVHASAVASLGSFHTRGADASGGYAWRHGSLGVSTGIAATERYLDPPVEENFTNRGTTSYFSARLQQDVSPADRVGVILRTGTTRFMVPNEIVQQQAGQRQDRTNRETAGLFSYQHLFASQLSADVRGMARTAAATLTSNPESIPVIAVQDRGFRELYVKAALSGLHRRHEWKVGGDVSAAHVREQFGFLVTAADGFADDVPRSFRFAGVGDDREAALFVQDQVPLGRWTLSGGLRWDSYRFLVHDNAFSPRLSAAWALTSDLVVRASYDRAFQTPAIENLLLASSPDVETLGTDVVHLPVPPSRGNFYELGLSKALRGTARLDASYFHRSADDFADDDVLLNTGISFPVALAHAAVDGVDLKVDVPLAGPLSASASYSWMKGSARLPVTGGLFLDGDAALLLTSTESFPITQDQRHTVRGRATYRVTPLVWTTVAAAYGSGLPFEFSGTAQDAATQYGARIVERVDFESERVRPRFSLDASLGVTLTPPAAARRVRVQVDLRNLTNRLDVINFAGLFSGTAIAPPRSVAVRVSAGF
jgi:outer membrane receptor protein involved in Fe transport